jgi:hypothetical protein
MRKFSPRNLIKVPGRKSYHDMVLEETGLVGYWNFGAGAGSKVWDQIGTSHGDITGATWTQKSNGIYTLDFDGNNDDVTISQSTDWYNQDWTLSLWFKLDALPVGAVHDTIFAQQDGGGTGRSWLLINGNTNALASLVSGTILNSIVIGTATWYHAVATFDESEDDLTIFVNGNQEANATRNMESAAGDFIIGASKALLNGLNGLVNEVAIYNTILSPETILQHYQVGVWEGLAEA